MRETLYVNGIAVGEVEATSDCHKDLEVMRQFLEDKGLGRGGRKCRRYSGLRTLTRWNFEEIVD